MNFATAAVKTAHRTFTENGAKAMDTSGEAVLDLFATIGALRNADETRITSLFAEAYRENPLLATKCLFYGRDIRGGLGERRTFRIILRWLADHHPEAVRLNIPLIPFFGRFDDLYALVKTPLEEDMWNYMKDVLELDVVAMNKGEPCSLLAKWIYTPTRTNKEAKELGILTAIKMTNTNKYKTFRTIVSKLRKYLKIVEVKMCNNEWKEIDYEQVPSKAALRYRNAFKRHDNDRYEKWISDLQTGEAKVNADTLYPYDLIRKYIHISIWEDNLLEEDKLVEAQWKALPNYVEPGTNAIVVADTSGSMLAGDGRPFMSAAGLAIYFAERNIGAYHNLWMSFSNRSNFHTLKGETLNQKLKTLNTRDWGGSTNLESAFNSILDVAIENNVKQEEMVKSIIVISDMEINQCEMSGWSFYNHIKSEYEAHGYKIPNVIFWNVESRHNIFHADATRRGVILVSGQSTSTFKNLIGAIDKTPVELMLDVLNDKRYDVVAIDKESVK